MSTNWNVVDQLDRSMPAAKRAQLGTVVQELIDQTNALGVAVTDLATRLDACLTLLDGSAVSHSGTTKAGYVAAVGTLSTATIAGYTVDITDLNDRA